MTTPAEGWHDLPLADYLAVPAMSSSGLRAFRRSPAHYRYARQHPLTETPAMHFGTAVHTAVLEPDLFTAYVTLGRCSATLKSGKDCSYAAKVDRVGLQFCGRHDDPDMGPANLTLTHDAMDRVQAIGAAVRAHPLADGLLTANEGTIERSGIFEDPETGVLCKFRPDRVTTACARTILVDLKTCRDAGPRFWRTIAERGYAHQAALYRRGLAKLGTACEAAVIIAVESEPPHGVGCYLLDEDDLARAHADITELLADYRECAEADEWLGYPVELHEGRVPEWGFAHE